MRMRFSLIPQQARDAMSTTCVTRDSVQPARPKLHARFHRARAMRAALFKELILTATYRVVVFSILVQGLTIGFVVHAHNKIQQQFSEMRHA